MAIGSKFMQIGRQPWALRPTRIAFLIGAVSILALCAATAWFILQLHSREILDAKRELITLDVLLVEETERSLQSVDLVLRNLQEKFAADGIASPEAYASTQAGLDTHELLRARIAGVPQIQAVSLIADDGNIINSSNKFPTAKFNVADRDYFFSLRDTDTNAPFLGEVVKNRGADTWNIFLARRVSAPDGTFLGLVVGVIDLSYFENLYKALQIGDGAAVSLWRKDGTMLARFPALQGAGRVFKSQTFERRHRTTTPQTFQVDRSLIDGFSRIVATVAGKQFPVVVDVGQSSDVILQDWRRISVLAIAGTMLFIVAIILILWLLTRQFAAFEALSAAVKQSAAADAARIEAEEQLRQSQKLEAIGELTGGIAHDFNNLLTAVIGNLDLLTRNAEGLNPRLSRWANSALEAAKRGATLTQRLLAYSRRQPLDPKPTNVVNLLNSMSELLRSTLGENIETQTNIANGLWPAFVDVNQLDSAILNLAINARDAMEGRGRLSIDAQNVTIGAGPHDNHLQIPNGDFVSIALRDTGKGISSDVLEKVFEPFFTTKPIGQGTGLGLSQVYGFLKQTGGQITIESELGQGTTVKMYLPRAAADEAVVEQSGGKVPDGIVILTVEDDDEVRAYTIETLTALGHSVREARNAPEALDLLRQDPTISFLLTDVGLPGMNGNELARHALTLRPDLKTLFTSGYARHAIMHHDRLDEGIQFLAKPFTREQLAQKISLVLDQTPQRVAS